MTDRLRSAATALLVRDVRLLGPLAVDGDAVSDASSEGTPAAGRYDIEISGGRIRRLSPVGEGELPDPPRVLEGNGGLACAPFVEPHVHLDTGLTAAEAFPGGNGTSCDDTISRAMEVLRWYAANGVLHIRTHVAITDPSLAALDALLEVRSRVRGVIDLQVAAYPREGICSYPRGAEVLEEAAGRGVDVIGAVPHAEDTREDGIRSLEIAVGVAARYGLGVDVHSDPADDELSRFSEVLAALARHTGLGERVTVSRAAMADSRGDAYSVKLRRLLARAGVNVVWNPLAGLCLSDGLNGYHWKRGVAPVRELLSDGVNVAFGHDGIMDPEIPLGIAAPLQIALIGIVAGQLTAPEEIDEAYAMVTERAARVLGIGEKYGIAEGRPASFVVLPAASPADAIRRQVRPRWVIAHGRVIAETPSTPTLLTLPGRAPEAIDFVPRTTR